LASTVANTQQEAILTVFMTVLPSVFLSGFIYPLAAMPVVLQWISYLIPLRYFLTIIRALMVKGVGLESILPDVIAMSIFGVLIMGAAALRFRKRLD
jgi:ABC-2 type transport system permease protein